jgi:hypothetical protein
MVRVEPMPSPERVAILRWVARMGAVTADALADHQGATVASARGRLLAAERDRLLLRRRPLLGQPALYTVTQAGMRMSGLTGLDPCRVGPSNASHLIACARAAGVLERCYPDHRVQGERELRRDEHQRGAPLASACLRARPGGVPVLHRPDLVLWPAAADRGLPVAVEVELTIKAPRRLAGICRAWARCRLVAGVLYLTAPEVERPLERALREVDAANMIVVVPLEALPIPPAVALSTSRTVPSDA